MTLRETVKALAVGTASALLLTSAGTSAAQEQRCVELGANCDCSETLDTRAPHYEKSGVPNNWYWNPSNTTGSLQCGDASGRFGNGVHDPDQVLHVVPARYMPAGSSVANVWEWRTFGVDTARGRVDKITSSTRRMCIRGYYNYTPDFSLWPDTNNKVNEIAWNDFSGGHGSLQGATSFGGSPIGYRVGNSSNGTFNVVPSGDHITPQDCASTWCLVEMCISGKIRAGEDLTADFWVHTTDGRLSASRTGTQVGDIAGGLYQIWIYNLWRGANPVVVGSRFMSHAMQASWDTDRGQRIGAAYEIEGGGSSGGSDGSDGSGGSGDSGGGSGSSGGSATLDVTQSTTGDTVLVTSTLTNGIGPYQFLFDCGNNGHWDGVLDNASGSSAEFSCALSADQARSWVWDKGTGETYAEIVQFNGSGSLSPPARPELLP